MNTYSNTSAQAEGFFFQQEGQAPAVFQEFEHPASDGSEYAIDEPSTESYAEDENAENEFDNYHASGQPADASNETYIHPRELATQAAAGYNSNSSLERARTSPEFQSMDDFRNSTDQRRLIEVQNLQRDRRSAGTCPTDPEEIRNIVGLICDAFLCTDEEVVIDKNNKKGGKAQAVNRFIDGFYRQEFIEAAAWEIFDKTRLASFGLRLISDHHTVRGEEEDHHEDFYSRLDSIINTLACSKAACKQALDCSFIDRLVSVPNAELKMKLGNSIINSKRDVQNHAGRKVLKAGLREDELDEIVQAKKAIHEDEEDEEDPPHPTYRTTPKKRPTRVQKATPSSKRRKTPRKIPNQARDASYETPVGPRSGNGFMASLPQPPIPMYRGQERATRIENSASEALGIRPLFPETDNVDYYRQLICDSLGVSRNFADILSLGDLRTYSYAFNEDKIHLPWWHPTLADEELGYGHLVHPPSDSLDAEQKHMLDFEAFLRTFGDLAAIRGDLANKNTYQPRARAFVGSQLPLKIQQAMGLVANPFGLADIPGRW